MSDRPTDRPIFHWYRPTPFGPELTVCLFTRGCRYGACSFCSLPSVTAGHVDVPYRDINLQVDYVFGRYTGEQLGNVWRVSLFNNGSVLDQGTLPTKSLLYFLLKVTELPNLRVVSLETRAEYVEDWELKVLKQVMPAHASLEVSLGFETGDERIRNQVLKKGLSEAKFEALLALLAANDCQLKCYVMLKPDVTLTEEQGIEEAVRTIRYLKTMADKHRVVISIHLNPTYVARGTLLERQFGERGYEPPDLESVFSVLLETRDEGLWIYVGLDDEGLAASGGEFRCRRLPRAHALEALEKFNATHDYRVIADFLDLACVHSR